VYRSLLVPLDGSAAAEHALPMALGLARRQRAVLHVVRVYVPVAGVYGEHATAHVPYDEALDRELMARARDYLDSVAARLAAPGRAPPSSALLEGWVPEAILRHAAGVGADLIVMTTHGRGPVTRFWLGSVSDEIARRATVPTLFVRPRAAAPDFASEAGVRRVLVPLDGSSLAEQALEPALALGTGTQAEYILLRVVTSTTELSYGPAGGEVTGFGEALKRLRESDQEEAKRAAEYLEGLARRLRTRSLVVNTRVLQSDRPATAILDEASARGVDLIALATRGRGGLKRLVLGSVADKVLRGAEAPVLTYRPPDGPPRAG
jgi:nucleotide-binding universal stress UspA family protein